MDKDRETKGTWLFKERLAPGQARGFIGTMYLTKPAVEQLGNPETIVVTVSAS